MDLPGPAEDVAACLSFPKTCNPRSELCAQGSVAFDSESRMKLDIEFVNNIWHNFDHDQIHRVSVDQPEHSGLSTFSSSLRLQAAGNDSWILSQHIK